MPKNPIIEAYTNAEISEVLNPHNLEPATVVVAELSPSEIKQGTTQALDGLISSGALDIDIGYGPVSSGPRILLGLPTIPMSKDSADRAYIQAQAETLSESVDKIIAQDNISKVNRVKQQQHRLGRRFLASLTLVGVLSGFTGMEALDVAAQTQAANSLDKAPGPKIPIYTHRPIDIIVDSFGAAGAGEAALFAGMALLPGAAKRRARRIVRAAITENTTNQD